MSWFVRNFISQLLLFPCNLLALQALAWVLRKRKPWLSRGLAVFAFSGLVILSCPEVGVRLVDHFESEVPPLRLDDADLVKRADAIVVLGAGRTFGARDFGKDTVSPEGALRLRYAVEVHRRTGKPMLLTGGTPDRGGESEAALMDAALRQSFGLQARWLEEKSINTAENAIRSYKLLSGLGIKRIFLVTSAFHMPRAMRSFVKAGFEVTAAPTTYYSDSAVRGPLGWIPSARGAEMSAVSLHEAIGALWYWLRGE